MLIVFLIFVHKCIAPFSALSGPGVLSWFVEICQWPDLLMSKLYWNTSILEMLWNVTKYGIQYRDPLKNAYLLAKIGTDTADILVTKWHQFSMKTRSCRSLLRALVLALWYRGILACWATMATSMFIIYILEKQYCMKLLWMNPEWKKLETHFRWIEFDPQFVKNLR